MTGKEYHTVRLLAEDFRKREKIADEKVRSAGNEKDYEYNNGLRAAFTYAKDKLEDLLRTLNT